jgi:Kef-type K+ transport system membrane component KefB
MSLANTSQGFRARCTEALALATCLGLALAVTKLEPFGHSHFNAILAVGYLLFAGTMLANLVEPLKLPHLTAYIAVGVVGGPYVLHLVDHEAVKHLVPVNTLAISLIALAGGLELEARLVVKLLRSLFWSNVVQTVIVGITTAGAFLLLSPYIPFTAGLTLAQRIGVAALWGLLATSRSPSATLAILAQTKAQGPLTRWTLAFVMSSDVIVVVLSALLFVAVRPLLLDDATLSTARLVVLAREIVGSVSLGICLGLVLSAYLRLVGKQLLLILLVLGFVVTDGLKYVHFDPLLAFLVTGFMVRNLSHQGEKLLEAVSRTSGVVFVVFFATAGSHLDLQQLRSMWPIAVTFFLVRWGATLIASRASSAIARDEPQVRRYGWAPLVSQAGLTLALSQSIEREFPVLAEGFRSLVIATVAVNEVIGPILFKFALERTGETSAPLRTRDSLANAELE